jgi:hypothetical protein
LHSLIASRPTATDLARGPLLPPRVDRRRCQTNRKNGSGARSGAVARAFARAASYRLPIKRVSVKAWATPTDDRCFARTVCLDASLRDHDTEACRSWQ